MEKKIAQGPRACGMKSDEKPFFSHICAIFFEEKWYML